MPEQEEILKSYPAKGDTLTDFRNKRKLHVTEVVPGDGLGREIRGTVEYKSGEKKPYSCSQQIYAAIWNAPITEVQS